MYFYYCHVEMFILYGCWDSFHVLSPLDGYCLYNNNCKHMEMRELYSVQQNTNKRIYLGN